MFKAPHLTVEQFARFQRQSLEAAELLACDEHLSGCEECRERLGMETAADARAQDLKALLSEHLSYDQVVTAAKGHGDGAIGQHLTECELCRAEVEDLRQFQSTLNSTPAK